MKKTIIGLAVLVIITNMAVAGCASDYKGDEKQDSIFQKLGDLVTGKYEVEGKPLKKIGVFQCSADQINKMESGPVK